MQPSLQLVALHKANRPLSRTTALFKHLRLVLSPCPAQLRHLITPEVTAHVKKANWPGPLALVYLRRAVKSIACHYGMSECDCLQDSPYLGIPALSVPLQLGVLPLQVVLQSSM
jgi:hypothetical protein